MITAPRASYVARTWLIVLASVLGASCHAVTDGIIAQSELLSMVASGPRSARQLRLDAAPGVRINARLLPMLELSDGTRVTFTSDALDADSSYFTASPTATLHLTRATRGTLLASVCPAAARVCLQAKLDIDLR